jgi:hypothetical protein
MAFRRDQLAVVSLRLLRGSSGGCVWRRRACGGGRSAPPRRAGYTRGPGAHNDWYTNRGQLTGSRLSSSLTLLCLCNEHVGLALGAQLGGASIVITRARESTSNWLELWDTTESLANCVSRNGRDCTLVPRQPQPPGATSPPVSDEPDFIITHLGQKPYVSSRSKGRKGDADEGCRHCKALWSSPTVSAWRSRNPCMLRHPSCKRPAGGRFR